MKTKNAPKNIALAVCSFALQVGADNTAVVQVTPAGVFYPSDGRAITVPGWKIDSAIASRVIERFNKRKTPLVIDYEHQTLRKEENGQPAPAAAWFKKLEWRSDGLYATVELTARARDAIAANEYKYFSPVFRFDPKTGEVEELEMGAITNTPAIDGMQELTMRAAACFGYHDEDTTMTLLQQLIALLAMAETATEPEVVAALTKKLNMGNDIAVSLGVDKNADPQTVIAACTALKTKSDTSAPLTVINQLQHEVAALNAKLIQRDAQAVDDVIAGALADGRLIAGEMETWARNLAKTNIAMLNAYLASAKPIAALNRTQTDGKKPTDNENDLTDDEQTVCKNLGLTHDEFKKAR